MLGERVGRDNNICHGTYEWKLKDHVVAEYYLIIPSGFNENYIRQMNIYRCQSRAPRGSILMKVTTIY